MAIDAISQIGSSMIALLSENGEVLTKKGCYNWDHERFPVTVVYEVSNSPTRSQRGFHEVTSEEETMASVSNLAGFPIKATHKFRINGVKYRIGNTGVKAIELALELLRRQSSSESLLALRPLIRDCTQGDCKAALSLLIEQTPN